MQFKCLWKGAAQSQLKFLLRGLGCSSHTCRRLWLTCKRAGCLGIEEQVGVSFIRAEARVVSMDSSSKSSMSNESTRETSFVTSATVLKGVCALGSFEDVGALGSFEGVGALGLL